MKQVNKAKETIEKQASNWFLLMQSDQSLSEEQLQHFINWLKKPQAEQAYTNCETLWELSGELRNDPDILASRTAIAQTYQCWLLSWWHSCNTSLRYGLQAASFAALALLFVGIANFTEQNTTDIYQTATGQQKTITLVDGSQITLNTSTEVHVSYFNNARKVVLESGEALFDVIKDKKRPFSVIADNGEITALGTIFNVKKSEGQHSVEVALLEGKIQVSADIQDKKHKKVKLKKILTSNELTSYHANTMAVVKKITDINKIIQWKEGRLSFTNATLKQVIKEVNRYTINKLIIEEPSLQEEKIDAYFVIGDTDTLLFALKETFNISWSYQANGILLYREKTAG